MSMPYIEEVTACDTCGKPFEVVGDYDDQNCYVGDVAIVPVDEPKLGHFCSNRCRSAEWFEHLSPEQRRAAVRVTRALHALLEDNFREVCDAFDEITGKYFGGFMEDAAAIFEDLADDHLPEWAEKKAVQTNQKEAT